MEEIKQIYCVLRERCGKVNSKEILDFVANIYNQNDNEIEKFCKRFIEAYPKMTTQGKKELDKRWDLMETLHFYLSYYN